MLCRKCNTENPDSSKFCGECGAPLAAAPAAERRQLTVLFIDLVGSSALAESWDPEDLRELIGKYQALCADVIQRYDGHVAQYLGDGILAYFGYPSAHEDDAVRAVQAGLDILAGLNAVSVSGQQPVVRIGIHTGLVVVGDVGAGAKREQLALGEAPNLAARVQAEAEPATLLISESTRQLVAGRFALEDAGARTLKGISRPVSLYKVSGRSAASSRFAAATAAGLAPFVGREAEVAAVRDAVERSLRGSGQTLVLRGEPGIGKSRLLGAAKAIAASLDGATIEAECSSFETNTPLHPIVGMLARHLGLSSASSASDKLDRLESLVSHNLPDRAEAMTLLADLFAIPSGDRYPSLELAPARHRQRTLEVLADVLLRSNNDGVTLLLVEDVHWADPSTLDLLALVVARQAAARVCMICTTRPEGVVSWSASHAREIHVGSLAQAETRALISGVAGGKALPAEVMQQLVARTGGIPLFVEAVTQSVLDAGVLRQLDDRYELVGTLPADLIPATVQDSLMARIDRLGGDKPVAQLASTIGRDFSFELLSSVSGLAPADLERALQHLVELGLVAQTGTPPHATYIFKHALIQDAANSSLLRKTRQEYHGRIAEALVSRFPEISEKRPELMAHHLSGAGENARAVPYWLLAGQAALGRAACHEAIAHLNRGLGMLDAVPPDERPTVELDLHAALAPALSATRGWASPELDRVYRRAGELVDLIGDTPHRLPVVWGTWAYHAVGGRIRQSVPLADQVLAMAIAIGEPTLLGPARQAAACSHCFHGDLRTAVEHAEAGLALSTFEREAIIARQFGHASGVCIECFNADALWMLGYPDRALAASDRALDLARRLNHMASLAWAVSYKTWFHHLLRDPARIMEMAEEGVRLAGEEGFAYWEPVVAIYAGAVTASRGDAAAGIARMRDGLARFRANGNGIRQGNMLAVLAETLWNAGCRAEAFEVLAEGKSFATTNGEGFHEPEFYRLEGVFQAAHDLESGGNTDALASAERNIRRALALAASQGAKSLELRAAMSLYDLQRRAGRSGDGRALLAEVYGRFDEGFGTPDLQDAAAMLE